MVVIGISICPLMTRDVEKLMYCREDCAAFCVYRDSSGELYNVTGRDGFCGMMPPE